MIVSTGSQKALLWDLLIEDNPMAMYGDAPKRVKSFSVEVIVTAGKVVKKVKDELEPGKGFRDGDMELTVEEVVFLKSIFDTLKVVPGDKAEAYTQLKAKMEETYKASLPQKEVPQGK